MEPGGFFFVSNTFEIDMVLYKSDPGAINPDPSVFTTVTSFNNRPPPLYF
jgi:hypothetical protein